MDFERKKLMKPFKEVEKWSLSDKEIYYSYLRDICACRKKKSFFYNELVTSFSPLLRNFEIEIRGIENIPSNTTALFVCNHSNSHDILVTEEVFSIIKRPLTPLVAWDGLNALSRIIFQIGDATFIDRSDKFSIERGILNFCSKILNGKNGIIFGEGTWNLHPVLPMLRLKAGVVQIGLITGKPLIPMILEYIEVPYKCKKEKELYSKCVVQFGLPIYVTVKENLSDQADIITQVMGDTRMKLWEEFGICKDSILKINREVYLNHLYLKKYKAVGFKYNSKWEAKFFLGDENEYCLNQNRDFVSGILKE